MNLQSLRTRLCSPAYLAAHFGKSLMWHSSAVLFAFFLTETCALAPATTGVVLAATLALNGLLDFLLGRWQRHRLTTAAAAVRFQAAGALAAAGCFALFCLAAVVPAGWRLPWVAVSLLGFRCTYPLIDVAQNALIALGNPSLLLRQRLTVQRNVVSALAHLLVCGAIAPLLISLSASSAKQFAIAGGSVAVVAQLTAALLWRVGMGTSQEGEALSSPASSLPGPALRLHFPTVLALAALAGVLVSAFRKLEPYVSAYAPADMRHALNLSVAVAAGLLLAQVVWTALLRRRNVATVLASTAVLLLAAALLLAGSGAVRQALIYAAGVCAGAGFGGLSLAIWLGTAASASSTGATWQYGTLTCVSKISQASGTLLTGLLLSLSDYRLDLGRQASAASMLVQAIPLVLGLACLGALLASSRRQQVAEQQRGGAQRRRGFGRKLGHA